MKVKLLIIAETLIDGVGKHINDLLTNLDKEKFEIHVIHSLNRTDDKFMAMKERLKSEIDFYQIEELDREIGLYDFKAFIKVNKLMKDLEPDIIHCHSSKAGVIGRVCGKIHGVKKTYYTPHAYAIQNTQLGFVKKSLYTWIERFLGNNCTTKTINVSKGENIFGVEHKLTTYNKSSVIYNCIENKVNTTDTDIREQLQIRKESIIVGSVARLFEQKNPYEFIKIAEKVISKAYDVYFVWIGNGEYKEKIDQMLIDKKLNERIKFIGYRNNVDVYLEEFDLYLSTSLYEGMPYTLIEAFRSACPCIASDVVGNNEIVVDNSNGYLYPLGNTDFAVTKIIDLLTNEETRKQFGINAVKNFEENYTLDKMILSHEALYLES